MPGRCRHCGGHKGGLGSSTSGTPVGHDENTCSSRPGAPKRDRGRGLGGGTGGASWSSRPGVPSRYRGRGLGGGTGGASWSSNRVPPAPRIKKIKSQDSSVLSIAEQLVLLAQLRDSGALTEQEFQSLKSRLISGA